MNSATPRAPVISAVASVIDVLWRTLRALLTRRELLLLNAFTVELVGILGLHRIASLPFLLFGFAPLMGGLFTTWLHAARGRPYPPFAFWRGFLHLDAWTGTVFMGGFHVVLAALPLAFSIGFVNLIGGTHPHPLSYAAGVATAIWLTSMWTRYALVPLVTADLLLQAPRGRSLPIQAVFQTTASRTEGQRGPLLLMALLLSSGLAGAVTYWPPGILALLPLGLGCLAHLYTTLTPEPPRLSSDDVLSVSKNGAD